MPNNIDRDSGWVGWVYFAGIMMIVSGAFQTISGLTGLLRDGFYVVTQSHVLAFSYTTWGWINLIMGIIVVAAGSAVMNGRTWGRIVGVALAVISTFANFAFISAYPIWSVMVIVVDLLVIYALMVHGNEA